MALKGREQPGTPNVLRAWDIYQAYCMERVRAWMAIPGPLGRRWCLLACELQRDCKMPET
jgi:hypothetical protein